MAETADEDRRGRKGLKFGFMVLRVKGFRICGSRVWKEGKVGESKVKDFLRVDRDEEEEQERLAMAAIFGVKLLVN